MPTGDWFCDVIILLLVILFDSQDVDDKNFQDFQDNLDRLQEDNGKYKLPTITQ